MFSRLATRLPKASGPAVRFPSQARFISRAPSDGSRGRSMPSRMSRAVPVAKNTEATFTIRVWFLSSLVQSPQQAHTFV